MMVKIVEPHSGQIKTPAGQVDDLRCEIQPYRESSVEFHKTRRNVRTPRSEQVRQPIFRDSLDPWKRYDAWLQPLKTALGDGAA